MYSDLKVALVIPCLNEEEGLGFVLSNKPDFFDLVMVVDNGSTDSTAKVANSFGAQVVVENKQGYGLAYKKGFSCLPADIDVVVTMDGDGSYSFDNLSGMLDRVISGSDFVSGSRFPLVDSSAMSVLNIAGNRFLSFVMSFLVGRRINDSQSGMWVFKRTLLKNISLQSAGMSFSQEIKMEVIEHSYSFVEMRIPYLDRFGKTKLRKWKDGWANLRHLFIKKFLIKR
jgi:dolichol-phosphate hexosyltransferase